jgi:hypothetical protein
MATDASLGDILAGAAGRPVNRVALNATIQQGQALAGLRTAQTEDALMKAAEMRDQQGANDRLEDSLFNVLTATGDPNARQHAKYGRDVMVGGHGNALQAEQAFGDILKNVNTQTLSDPSKLGSPAQTAAQQGIQGKVATPFAVPENYGVLPGQTPPDVMQSPQGAAHTAQTKAMTAEDIARAEEAHAKAQQATTGVQTGMSPADLHNAALVVMADPSKMSQYATYGKEGQAIRTAVNHQIAQELNEAGMTAEDMIRQRALAKANVGAAGQAAKQAATLDAYMPLVRSNGERVLELINSISQHDADLPLINGYERSIGRALNDDDKAELHSVITGFQAELGRMLTAGPTMNGVVSDHARQEAAGMAPETMSASQAKRIVNRIFVEMGIRRQGVQNALDESVGNQAAATTAGKGKAAPQGGAGSQPQTGGAISLDEYLKSKGF